MTEKKKHNILKLKLNVAKNDSSNVEEKMINQPLKAEEKPNSNQAHNEVKIETKVEELSQKGSLQKDFYKNFEAQEKNESEKEKFEEKTEEKVEYKPSFRGMPQIIESPRNKTTVFYKPNNNYRSGNVPRGTDQARYKSEFKPYNKTLENNQQPRFNKFQTDQSGQRRFNNNYNTQKFGSSDFQKRPGFDNKFDPKFGPKPGPNERYTPRYNPAGSNEKYGSRPGIRPGMRPHTSTTSYGEKRPYNPNFDPNKSYNRPGFGSGFNANSENKTRFNFNSPNKGNFNPGKAPSFTPAYNEFAKKQDTYSKVYDEKKKRREYDEKPRTRTLDTEKGINVTEFVGRVDTSHLETHAFSDAFSRRKIARDKPKPDAFIKKNIEIFGPMSIKDIASKMSMRSNEVLSIARKLGLDTNEKKNVSADDLHIIIEECGHEAIRMDEQNKAKLEFPVQKLDPTKTKPRPPIVVVVGHVDHGKTSLLDRIRKSGVAKKEAGGITQSIGAYQVKTDNGIITFIDTPGHEAFTQMRANGVKVTDIAILVVSAEDSVKPQTIEAITHIEAAKVPIIVAITKCDLPNSNLEKVKADLLAHKIVPEEYGGEVPCIPVSSVTGQNIDELLKAILLQAEFMELKANEEADARAIVLESKLDPKIGAVATLLIQEGVLKNMDYCIANISSGKIKAMRDADGNLVKQASPSMPVEVVGFDSPPPAGSQCAKIPDMKTAQEILQARRLKAEQENKSVGMNLNFANFSNEEKPIINLILRSETQGSLEALKLILAQLNNEKSETNFVLTGVGAIKESDIDLAVISNAHIVGFKTKTPTAIAKNAEDKKIKIIEDDIIYNLVDQIKAELLNIIKPEEKEVLIGTARIQQIFSSSKLGNIAGCIVTSGLIKNGMIGKIIRKDKIIATTKIDSLKRNKDNVKEVANGLECGIILDNFDALNVGDEIQCFKIELVQNQ